MVSYQLNEPFLSYAKVGELPSGVEIFKDYEHFPIISIKSLNMIENAVKKLEKALADNLVGNNVEVITYKL